MQYWAPWQRERTHLDRSLGAALANTHFATSAHARVRAPADGGTSTRSHGVAPAQECRLRHKRPPPKAAPWFPPFKSSTPDRVRGSCASASSAPWQTETLKFPFWKGKIALGAHFSSKTESKRFRETRRGSGRTRPNLRVAR